jgi:hypothetical protein
MPEPGPKTVDCRDPPISSAVARTWAKIPAKFLTVFLLFQPGIVSRLREGREKKKSKHTLRDSRLQPNGDWSALPADSGR